MELTFQLRRLSETERQQGSLRQKNKQVLTRNVQLSVKSQELVETVKNLQQVQQPAAGGMSTAPDTTNLKRSLTRPNVNQLCSPSKASLSICFIKLKLHLFTWRVLSGQYALISFLILVFSSIRNRMHLSLLFLLCFTVTCQFVNCWPYSVWHMVYTQLSSTQSHLISSDYNWWWPHAVAIRCASKAFQDSLLLAILTEWEQESCREVLLYCVYGKLQSHIDESREIFFESRAI